MAAERDQLVRGKRRHAPITITEHAVDRFHARHCPEESRAKARALLKAAAASAVHLREKTGAGQERWQTEDGIILVVKRDPALRSAVVVTALPRGDHWDEDPLEGEGDAAPEIRPTESHAHPARANRFGSRRDLPRASCFAHRSCLTRCSRGPSRLSTDSSRR